MKCTPRAESGLSARSDTRPPQQRGLSLVDLVDQAGRSRPRPAWPCAIRAGAANAAKRRRLRRHMMPLERGGKHSPDHAGIDHSLLTSLRSLGARSVRRLQARGNSLPRVDNSGLLPRMARGWLCLRRFQASAPHETGSGEPVSNRKVLPFAVSSICDPLRKTPTRPFQSSPSRLTAEPETILP